MRRRWIQVPILALLAMLLGAGAASQARPLGPDPFFLVAQPDMDSPAFRETVILVTPHLGRGHFGLIVNRPTDLSIAESVRGGQEFAAAGDTLYFGGPVEQNSRLYLYRGRRRPVHSTPILERLHFGSLDSGGLGMLDVSDHRRNLRVFGGYAGWAPGQLPAEIGRGDWYVRPADVDMIFDVPPNQLWRSLLGGPGKSVRAPARGDAQASG